MQLMVKRRCCDGWQTVAQWLNKISPWAFNTFPSSRSRCPECHHFHPYSPMQATSAPRVSFSGSFTELVCWYVYAYLSDKQQQSFHPRQFQRSSYPPKRGRCFNSHKILSHVCSDTSRTSGWGWGATQLCSARFTSRCLRRTPDCVGSERDALGLIFWKQNILVKSDGLIQNNAPANFVQEWLALTLYEAGTCPN